MAGSKAVSAVVIEEPASFSHTFQIHARPAALKASAAGVAIYSDPFPGAGGSWKLKVYPGGNSAEYKDHISVFLHVDKPIQAEFTVLAGGTTRSSLYSFSGTDGKGWAKFVSHEAATAWLNSHGGRMDMTITVQPVGVAVVKRAQAQPEPDAPLAVPVPSPALSSELRALLSSGARSDCTLVCHGERFPAHTFVLALRSAVFAAQLSPPPGLTAPDLAAIPVPEEVQPSVLRKLLEYVYTDEDADFADVDEAQHLLNAADHYGLVRLRAMCERHLEQNLSADTAAFTLTLADQHGAAGLRESAARFIAANAKDVLDTDGWDHLVQSRPQLAQEVLECAVMGGRKRRRSGATPGGGEGGADGAAAGAAEGADGEQAARRPRTAP